MKSNSVIRQSNFKNFLDTALVFTAQNFVKDVVNTHRHVYGHKSHVYVLESMFSNCSAISSHGGALFFDRHSIAASIDRCSFLFCTTKRVGGAFYGIFVDFGISRTCFYSCVAADYGHAYFVNLLDTLGQSLHSQINVYNSSSSAKFVGKSSIVLMVGYHFFQGCNMSNNAALAYSSTIGCLVVSGFSMSFSDVSNNSAPHLFRFYNTNLSILSYVNVYHNLASTSLLFISSVSDYLHCVFTENYFKVFVSGFADRIVVSCCVFDVVLFNYSNDFLHTYNLQYTTQPELLLLHNPFSDGCRVIGADAGDYHEYYAKFLSTLEQDDPQFDLKDVVLQRVVYPTIPVAPPATEKDQTPGPTDIPKPTKNQKVIIDEDDEKEKPVSPSTVIHSETPILSITVETKEPIQENTQTPMTQTSSQTKQPKTRHDIKTNTLKPRTKKPKKKTIQTATPSASFSASSTFQNTRTFMPSMQFTSSLSPAQSLVPYVLYSAAGFVVFAVLTSFLFLKSGDTGYNLMTPSESAESKISDYASSTSTTVTMTKGESSSMI